MESKRLIGKFAYFGANSEHLTMKPESPSTSNGFARSVDGIRCLGGLPQLPCQLYCNSVAVFAELSISRALQHRATSKHISKSGVQSQPLFLRLFFRVFCWGNKMAEYTMVEDSPTCAKNTTINPINNNK